MLPNAVLGTLIFVGTELMLFAGMVSAFTIFRSGMNVWPPIGQPRLPFADTAINTAFLFLSGAVLFVAHKAYISKPERAKWPLLGAIVLGAMFVVGQGMEWVALLGDGLTMRSHVLGAFFYLIIGTHALHTVAALLALGVVWLRLRAGKLRSSTLFAAEAFWYFVVGVWPLLYWRVYL